jgi:hypothetical protein
LSGKRGEIEPEDLCSNLIVQFALQRERCLPSVSGPVRAAATLGHGQAQLMLGRYLKSGVASEPNLEEALKQSPTN